MDQELKTYLEGMENRLFEKVRNMQEELLATFESVKTAHSIRLDKLEADQANSEYLAVKRRCP